MKNSIYINTLIKVSDDVIKNNKSDIELRKLCNILEGLYRKLTVLYDHLFQDSHEEKIKGYVEEFRRLTVEISKCLEDRNNRALQKNVDEIIKNTELLYESLKKLRKKEEKLPYYSRSPLLNEFIISATGVINGTFLPCYLKEKIIFLKKFTEATEKQLYSLECDTVTFCMEYPSIIENLSLFKEGLLETECYFSDKNKSHIKKGVDMTVKATDKLFASLHLLYEASDIITKTMCLKCCHKNSLHADFCALCHTILPKTGTFISKERYEIKDFEYIITDNLNNLLEGARQIEYGEITHSEFKDILNSMKEKLRKINFNLIQHKSKTIGDIFLYVQENLKAMEHGIKHMEDYNKNPDNLDMGLTLILESSKILYEIQLLAVEAERELKRRNTGNHEE